MRIGRVNRSTWRKPFPLPLCLAQIPHDLIWDKTEIFRGDFSLPTFKLHVISTGPRLHKLVFIKELIKMKRRSGKV
jgi:hypothetical protein